MRDWFSRYPSSRIEDVGTPVLKSLEAQDTAEFDYIIVGGLFSPHLSPLEGNRGNVNICMFAGGTAGCVLANRLSANPNVNVLLIERGQINSSLLASSILLSFPHVGIVPSRGIKTAPQRNLDNREDVLYESLSLGGRTRINAALYLPGCPAEYDSWGEGWQWKDVGQIFSRSEGCLDGNPGRRSEGEGGEWKTRTVKAEFESSRQ
jgi:choline dehydrogenase-like flavoprotein